jgi:hypothetical protein
MAKETFAEFAGVDWGSEKHHACHSQIVSFCLSDPPPLWPFISGADGSPWKLRISEPHCNESALFWGNFDRH